jgi:hypothetical protein
MKEGRIKAVKGDTTILFFTVLPLLKVSQIRPGCCAVMHPRWHYSIIWGLVIALCVKGGVTEYAFCLCGIDVDTDVHH